MHSNYWSLEERTESRICLIDIGKENKTQDAKDNHLFLFARSEKQHFGIETNGPIVEVTNWYVINVRQKNYI